MGVAHPCSVFGTMRVIKRNDKGQALRGEKTCRRLYVKGIVLGYKRSKVNQYPNISLVKLQNVETKKDSAWYHAKRVAYVYKAKTEVRGTKWRCIWGKVRR